METSATQQMLAVVLADTEADIVDIDDYECLDSDDDEVVLY